MIIKIFQHKIDKNKIIHVSPNEKEIHKKLLNDSNWILIDTEDTEKPKTIKANADKSYSSQQMFEEHCKKYFDNYRKIRMLKTSSLKKIGVVIQGYNDD